MNDAWWFLGELGVRKAAATRWGSVVIAAVFLLWPGGVGAAALAYGRHQAAELEKITSGAVTRMQEQAAEDQRVRDMSLPGKVAPGKRHDIRRELLRP
jgi:hypothetical protein